MVQKDSNTSSKADYEDNALPDLPDLSWMDKTFQWGTKALPEKKWWWADP